MSTTQIGALALVAAILFEMLGTLSLKAAADFANKLWLVPVVVGYTASLVLLSVTLSHGVAVGVAYGIWAAAGVALTAIFGRILFKDPLTWTMCAGIVLIMGGIVAIELGA